VDADVLRSVVEGRCTGKADHAVLRSRVRGAALDADDSCARGRVDDCAASLLEDQRNLVLHAQEHAAEVGVDDPVPLLLLVLRGRSRLPRLDARVVECEVSRPKASTVLSRAAITSAARVTSHRTASARPPRASIMRAVSWLPCSDTSASTTPAPSWANASAAARPMPLAAPVTNATFPVKSALPCVSIRLLLRGLFRNLWVVKWLASWTQQRLDRATLS